MNTLQYIGIGLLVILCFCMLFLVVGVGFYFMSTSNEKHVITPQNGESFEVVRVTSCGDGVILYTKPDGTTGIISGSFRMEQRSK